MLSGGDRRQSLMVNQTIKIQQRLTRVSQTLLFSATFLKEVRNFALKVASKPFKITVKTKELTLDGIKQCMVVCNSRIHKYETLVNIYLLFNIGQCIIFANSIQTAKSLSQQMKKDGYTVGLLFGRGMRPRDRDDTMEDFRKARITVLITTNVLARGIDVTQVNLVVNYDVPMEGRPGSEEYRPDSQTYIHRIGRLGRYGRKGIALNFVVEGTAEIDDIQFISRKFKVEMVRVAADDLEQLEQLVVRHIDPSQANTGLS